MNFLRRVYYEIATASFNFAMILFLATLAGLGGFMVSLVIMAFNQ